MKSRIEATTIMRLWHPSRRVKGTRIECTMGRLLVMVRLRLGRSGGCSVPLRLTWGRLLDELRRTDWGR
jgi:hypothetical protein